MCRKKRRQQQEKEAKEEAERKRNANGMLIIIRTHMTPIIATLRPEGIRTNLGNTCVGGGCVIMHARHKKMNEQNLIINCIQGFI